MKLLDDIWKDAVLEWFVLVRDEPRWLLPWYVIWSPVVLTLRVAVVVFFWCFDRKTKQDG